ncbi:hypothetical protein [Bradyrhizobium australafricanum]|uniref:hypothetical protein n=1 Tax=Bradyrhizobium australafricanum TaxID=2821406 RepID=UPI00114287F7|nr:hypothetical protein [Bradyrhizobium australafricanum]MCA6104968.1 hypothetical protein [Bradyrhizobium australafricanum]
MKSAAAARLPLAKLPWATQFVIERNFTDRRSEMRAEITKVFMVSLDTWQVNYDFAGVSPSMTVRASDAASARLKAEKELARYNVR